MNMFRCGDMMVRIVVDYEKSLFLLVSRTFDRDGIRYWEYFHSKDNNKTTISMYQACYEYVSLCRYDGSNCR
jgi:hypothetical protein